MYFFVILCRYRALSRHLAGLSALDIAVTGTNCGNSSLLLANSIFRVVVCFVYVLQTVIQPFGLNSYWSTGRFSLHPFPGKPMMTCYAVCFNVAVVISTCTKTKFLISKKGIWDEFRY